MNLDQLETLIKLGVGDIERLKHIKQSLEEGRIIYNSDNAYVEKLVLQHISSISKNRDSSQKTLDEVEPSNEESDDESTESEINSNVAFCGNCGQKVAISNNFCQKCGAKINQNNSNSSDSQQNSYSQPNASSRLQRHPKDETLTLLLSFVLGMFGIQGVGHMYVGKVGTGVAYLIVSIIIMAIAVVNLTNIQSAFGIIIGIPCIIMYIVMFIWQVLDSRKLCREYNDYYEQHGTPKW